MSRNRMLPVALLAAALVLTGCASARALWPFGRKAPPVPQPVAELQVESPSGGNQGVLQFWERNTLVIDLQQAPAAGQVVLKRTAAQWPVRIALRMLPGRFENIEVRGAERVVLPVAAQGPAVTAELAPGVVTAQTAELRLSWGARGAF